MKGNAFIIEIHGPNKEKGLYRMLGDGQAQAIDRAQIAFKNEFGEIGKVTSVKMVG